jgi:hypothetical protein
MQTVPVATRTFDKRLAPRELVAGVAANGSSKAYPMKLIDPRTPIVDVIGGVPIVLMVATDRRSVRAFRRIVDRRPLEFFADGDTLVDSATGSQWDFSGRAVRGPLAGQQLGKIAVLRDYWFDWRTYQPETSIYRAGL